MSSAPKKEWNDGSNISEDGVSSTSHSQWSLDQILPPDASDAPPDITLVDRAVGDDDPTPPLPGEITDIERVAYPSDPHRTDEITSITQIYDENEITSVTALPDNETKSEASEITSVTEIPGDEAPPEISEITSVTQQTPFDETAEITALTEAPEGHEITAVTQLEVLDKTDNVEVTPMAEAQPAVEASAISEEPVPAALTPAGAMEPSTSDELPAAAFTETTAVNSVEQTSAPSSEPNQTPNPEPAQPKHEPTPMRPLLSDFSRKLRRIGLAAAISATGFAVTIAWYRSTSQRGYHAGSKPIARIVRAINEVQRKPISKLIWQPIADKDIIYVGEAIRTASSSEATIEFIESKTRIDLDPDSAIVLEESAGQLALNFLQGNLFVKSGGGGAGEPNITLNTGDKQIALGNSELSVGKTTSGKLDLQVLKGQAQVQGDGQTLTLSQGKSLSGATLRILKPSIDDAIYIDPTVRERVVFEWEKIGPNYTVTLEAGPSRTKLAPVASARGDAGRIEGELKLGRVYYRLTAKSTAPEEKDLSSIVYKNTVYAKTPPAPLAPEQDAQIMLSQESPSVLFIWSNPSNFEQIRLELARTPDFSGQIFERVVTGKNEIALDLKADGSYYWRLSGQIKGKTIAQSRVASFKVKMTKGLPAPGLLKPEHQIKLPYDNVKEDGLLLSWEQVPQATSYKIRVEGKGHDPIELDTVLLQTRLKDLKPGIYAWSVSSTNDKGETSPWSEKRQFELAELPVVPWADNSTRYEYLTLKPMLEVSWLKPAVPVARFRVKIFTEDEATTIQPVIVSSLQHTFQLPNDGAYTLEVEGLNARGAVVARSVRRQIEVASAPLLPPPQFLESVPVEIMANNSGIAELAWTTVDGARRYILILKNPNGEPKRELAFVKDEARLRGLMPGEYKITLRSVDKHGRRGPESEERILKVPNVSNVRAPKLKGLKVK